MEELRRIAEDGLVAARAPTPQEKTLTEILERQTAILEKTATSTEKRTSTIRVEPRVHWPRLGDDGPGGKEVEEFYERLEEIFGLANNGKGMSWPEMLVAKKSCLHGSRRKIYENIMKKQRTDGI